MSVIDFYDRHPISEAHVLDALRRRGNTDRPTPEDLFDWDQDHYGGLAAIDALARRAGIERGARVLDVCGGLGGPARFLAHRFGAHVTALDLNGGRCRGGARLSRLVGLHDRVIMVQGDAAEIPFRRGAFTAAVSQEGLMHVPDKSRALAECARVLTPGGRLAFTDWVATPRLGDGERRRLHQWMAAVSVESSVGYRGLLARVGFVAVEAEDLTRQWLDVLRQRHAAFRGTQADTIARIGQACYDEYDQLFVFFVGLVEAGKLGGARFSATAGPASV